MSLKKILGDAYKEDLTATEIEELLTANPIIAKATFDKTATELASANRKIKEFESAGQTETEALTVERDEARAELDKIKREYALASAQWTLVQSGLTEELAKPFLHSISTDDAKEAIKQAKELAQVFTAQAESVRKEVEMKLMSQTQKPGGAGGDDNKIITAEEFGKMTYMEHIELKHANPELYESLVSQNE